MNTEDDEFARIAREQALNKMADNARELGLDYEPAQQEPADATKIAAQILTYLGFSQDESLQPGADRRRDTVAMMIENAALQTAQRTWVGLTDEAIWLEYQNFWPFHPAEEPTLAKDIARFARAIEAKLKEKNA